MATRATMNFRIDVYESSTVEFGEGTVHRFLEKELAMGAGTSNGQIDRSWVSGTRTLNTTSEELDLSGSLTDGFSNIVNYVEVVGIVFQILSGTGTLTVGGAAANGFVSLFADSTDKIVVRPGFPFVMMNTDSGYTVTSGTADKLKVESSTAMTYRAIFLGRES